MLHTFSFLLYVQLQFQNSYLSLTVTMKLSIKKTVNMKYEI